MTTRLQHIEEMLVHMSRPEKARILRWVVADLGDDYPGIDHRPDVCGGEACVVRTRIPVWTLARARQLGAPEADLLRAYPALSAEDLASAWAYARNHREEIEQQIAAHEQA